MKTGISPGPRNTRLMVSLWSMTRRTITKPALPAISRTPTHLTYMQARYYDSVVSRFLSHDPVQFSVEKPLMFNRYAYAGSNPISYVDPTGEIAPLAIIVGGFLFGAGLDLGVQLFRNGRNFKCLNYTKAFVSGLASASPIGRIGYVMKLKKIPFKALGTGKLQARYSPVKGRINGVWKNNDGLYNECGCDG